MAIVRSKHVSLRIVLLLSRFIASTYAEGEGTSDDLNRMFKVMEVKTLEWAKRNEQLVLPANRCDPKTLSECSKANYNGCVSEFPFATCPGAENTIPRCGDGEEGGCSGLFDFTATRVSLVKDEVYFRNSIDRPNEREKDGVCSTLQGDEFIVNARAEQEEYWNDFKVLSPVYFYGNDDGVFRILPANSEDCPVGQSKYDPRVRPWYVAASSGPKDVILILDTSGSMGNYGRLDIMKEAALRVINTLGASDFFSVISFNDRAEHVGSSGDEGRLMLRANYANKEIVSDKIQSLKADGGTNFYSGFDLAFETLRNSEKAEFSSNCHKAVLFLTDGQNQDPTPELLAMISSNVDSFGEASDRPAIFTYSFGSGADKEVPKRIACENDGIWASVGDGGNLADSMGAYYKYFANGLSGTENENFVAWVEPYVYATTGELGTTASAPVYDRSTDPPVLAGVVGLDFSFAAMERALGEQGEEAKNAVLKSIVERSTATCPELRLDPCRLQSLREYGSGDDANGEAVCDNVTDEQGNACATNPLKSPLCDFSSTNLSYPNQLWNNYANEDRTFEEKVCCNVGEKPRLAGTLSDEEKDDLVCVTNKGGGSVVWIIGLAFGLLFALLIFFFIYRRFRRKKTSSTTFGNDNVVVLPPPTAPPH